MNYRFLSSHVAHLTISLLFFSISLSLGRLSFSLSMSLFFLSLFSVCYFNHGTALLSLHNSFCFSFYFSPPPLLLSSISLNFILLLFCHHFTSSCHLSPNLPHLSSCCHMSAYCLFNLFFIINLGCINFWV